MKTFYEFLKNKNFLFNEDFARDEFEKLQKSIIDGNADVVEATIEEIIQTLRLKKWRNWKEGGVLPTLHDIIHIFRTHEKYAVKNSEIQKELEHNRRYDPNHQPRYWFFDDEGNFEEYEGNEEMLKSKYPKIKKVAHGTQLYDPRIKELMDKLYPQLRAAIEDQGGQPDKPTSYLGDPLTGLNKAWNRLTGSQKGREESPYYDKDRGRPHEPPDRFED